MVKLGSMDILFIGFLYPSFLFHQKQLEEKTNESKPTGDNSILSTNTEHPPLLSAHDSDEAQSTEQRVLRGKSCESTWNNRVHI